MINQQHIAGFRTFKQRVITGTMLWIIGCSILPLGLFVRVLSGSTELADIRTETEQLDVMSGTGATFSPNISAPVLVKAQRSTALSWINNRAASAGCELTAVRPSSGSHDFESTWAIRVVGSYHCVGKLVEAFEQSKHIVHISEITSSLSRTGNGLRTDILLSIWFVT